MSVGTLVVNERIYPIARIVLHNGLIMMVSEPIPGPVSFPPDSEVHVHAPDGSLVLTGRWTLDPDLVATLDAMGPDQTAVIEFPVGIDEVIGWPVAGRRPG